MNSPPWRKKAPEPGRPADRAAVLLASSGKPFSQAAVQAAVRAAGGRPVRVLSIAKIYGTALGLQHPGLLPSKREMAAQEAIITDAVTSIERAGGRAKGELIASRDPAKTFRRAAIRYSVRHVVLDPSDSSRLRTLVEGDPARSLRRHLDPSVKVEVVKKAGAGS